MKNQALKDQWKVFECAEELARFSIITDFLKQSVNQLYELKAKKEKIDDNDIVVFSEKFDEFKNTIDKLLLDIK